MSHEDEDSALKKVLGYQVGNMTGVLPGPLTAVKLGVDFYLDSKEKESKGTSIEVYEEDHQNDTISSKPENKQQLEGGDKFMAEDDMINSKKNNKKNAVRNTDEKLQELVNAVEVVEGTSEEFEEMIEAYDSEVEALRERYNADLDQDVRMMRGIAEVLDEQVGNLEDEYSEFTDLLNEYGIEEGDYGAHDSAHEYIERNFDWIQDDLQ